MNNTIYLVGFMGCGKTTVGELLGRKIGDKVVDLDEFIVAETGTGIPQLFAKHGEAYFRQIESRCIQEVGAMGHGIVCTGGGIVKEAVNRTFLKERCCIYLQVDFETLYDRVAKDPNRPLATTKEALQQLYDQRQAWYEEVATYKIVGDFKTPLQVVDEIMQLIR